jgi:hypothetical protein
MSKEIPPPDPYRRCERLCTHDLALGVEIGDELLEEDGPHDQGFAWDEESVATLKAAGSWNAWIQAGIKKPLFWNRGG